jgi:hypothetical protein
LRYSVRTKLVVRRRLHGRAEPLEAEIPVRIVAGAGVLAEHQRHLRAGRREPVVDERQGEHGAVPRDPRGVERHPAPRAVRVLDPEAPVAVPEVVADRRPRVEPVEGHVFELVEIAQAA